ncbi:probable basic-leucine zipper transcription factor E [Impatiens glandulifera]|uniref:probable basic-leucine zipper transcription factor E n=1 Tax=Impatiens glandulifera TaxID=253017 RepID=UPI001FB193A7|nr:probable basic-leucine zipper transcription factor E [Impatiens glandulifera]
MSSQRDNNAQTDQLLGNSQGQAMRSNAELMTQNTEESEQQSTSYLQKTGESMKNIAAGAAIVAQDAVAGAVNLAQGAAATVKNTLGVNSSENENNNNTTNSNNNANSAPPTSNINNLKSKPLTRL